MGLEPRPGDDAQRAFTADEEFVEVGALRGRRPAASDHHRPVGQHHFERGNHVVDLSVASAVLPGSAMTDPAADGGEVEALREVADGEAVTGADEMLEVGAERARPHLDQTRHHVDRADTLQAGEVEQHAAVHRHGGTHHAAASARRGDRYVVLVAQPQHIRHLLGGGGARHHSGPLQHFAAQRPVQCERPPVAAGVGRRAHLSGGRADGGELSEEPVG